MATRNPNATSTTAKKTASKTPEKNVAAAPKKGAAKPPGKSVAPIKTPKPAAKPIKKKSVPESVAEVPEKSAVRKSTTPKHITPKKALANTRALLEAKNEKSRQPPSYPSGGGAYGHQHAFGPTENQAHSQHQTAPGIEPEATEGHKVPRGNQGDRNQS